MTKSHVCNRDNQFYKYAEKNRLSLMAVIPKNHCWICGDVRK